MPRCGTTITLVLKVLLASGLIKEISTNSLSIRKLNGIEIKLKSENKIKSKNKFNSPPSNHLIFGYLRNSY